MRQSGSYSYSRHLTGSLRSASLPRSELSWVQQESSFTWGCQSHPNSLGCLLSSRSKTKTPYSGQMQHLGTGHVACLAHSRSGFRSVQIFCFWKFAKLPCPSAKAPRTAQALSVCQVLPWKWSTFRKKRFSTIQKAFTALRLLLPRRKKEYLGFCWGAWICK